jgi:DNA-directed RNA polymerase subunit RPC12/RpoP
LHGSSGTPTRYLIWLVHQSGLPQFEAGVDEITYLKIACPSCTGRVEFPLPMRGQIIACPHCSLSLVLDLPGSPPALPPPANLYQRLRALNNLPPPPVIISLPKAFRQPPRSQS